MLTCVYWDQVRPLALRKNLRPQKTKRIRLQNVLAHTCALRSAVRMASVWKQRAWRGHGEL
jgi:hypothetical protein